MTATWSYNLWDEIILQEELRFLQEHYGTAVSFKILTHDKKSAFFSDPDAPFVTYFPHAFWRNPFMNIYYFLNNIWLIIHADIIIIGGGGIFFDNEEGTSFKSLIMQWFFRIKLARLSGTTIIFLGISIEVKKTANKMQLRRIFQKGDFIIVRDERSASLLGALEIPCSEIPDIWFLYKPVLIPPPPWKKRIGISFRWGFLWDNEEIIPEIYEYFIKQGYDPVFLIHTTSGNEEQNDITFIKRVMRWKTYNTTGTIQNTLKVYSTLYAVIGMRFHAAVLACVHEIPLFLLSYWPKTETLIMTLEMEEFILRPNQINMERITKMWERLEKNYDRRKKLMQDKHEFIRDELIKKLETL